MTKRISQNQLTAENWMNEDEPEDAGTFEQAGENKLQGRVIKKAKRRLPEDKNGVPTTPFAKFAGFETKKDASTVSFSFLQSKPSSNGSTHKLSDKKAEPASSQPINTDLIFKNKALTITEHSKPDNDQSGYLEKLKSLNLSFMGWIKEHLDKNSFCDFSPVCTDYIEHVQRLEKLKSPADSKSEISKRQPKENPFISKPNLESTPVTSGFSFLPKRGLDTSDAPEGKNTPVTSKLFSFFSSAASPSCPPDSKLKLSSEKPVGGFVFLPSKDSKGIASDSPAKPFSFSSQVASAKTESPALTVKEEDDENYVPPKNEFEAVIEPDSLYNKRVKLFFKKEENYVDKGVGTLFLKKTVDNKTQLIVRANTSLGKILLNIIISEALPIERRGKNNVLTVCIPTAELPVDPKDMPDPTTVLFRVKTSEEADELFEKLKLYKSSN